MVRPSALLTVAIFLASTSIAPLAWADATAVLEAVTFNDGATASGYISVNVYGYLNSDTSLTTTAGPIFDGDTFMAGGFEGAPPASRFVLNSANYEFSLILDLAAPLGPASSNFDALVPGSINGPTLSGSYEQCNEGACGGAGVYRLVTAGTTYAPEPATLSLLGFGAAVLKFARRRRTDPKASAV